MYAHACIHTYIHNSVVENYGAKKIKGDNAFHIYTKHVEIKIMHKPSVLFSSLVRKCALENVLTIPRIFVNARLNYTCLLAVMFFHILCDKHACYKKRNQVRTRYIEKKYPYI